MCAVLCKYMDICICAFTELCTCICVCMHVCMGVCIYTCTFTNSVYMCEHACACIWVCIHFYIWIQLYVWACMCTHECGDQRSILCVLSLVLFTSFGLELFNQVRLDSLRSTSSSALESQVPATITDSFVDSGNPNL